MITKKLHTNLLLLFVFLSSVTYGQETKETLPYGGNTQFLRDTIPDLSFQQDTTTVKKKKKKKKKKNLFYGKKTRKGYTRHGINAKQTVELFYVLKKHEEPTGYIDDLYIWDLTKGRVVKVKKDRLVKYKNYKVLHGPYSKYVGGRIMESGIFYVGTKHGRWERYKWESKWWEPKPENKFSREETHHPILQGKTKYYKGFPKEAKVTYYDFDQKKVKEVVPFEFEEQTGDYFYFSEDGEVLIKGYYDNGKKVGLWIEYFEKKHVRKKEIQYPEDQWDDTEPVVLKEWNENGQIIVMNGEKVAPGTIKKADPIKDLLRRKNR